MLLFQINYKSNLKNQMKNIKKIIYLANEPISILPLKYLIDQSKINNSSLKVIHSKKNGIISKYSSSQKIESTYINTKNNKQMSSWNEQEKILNQNADLVLTCAFGFMIPDEMIDNATYSLNLHASLLPMYPGTSPIQQSILNRDKVFGCSLIEMSKGAFDQGSIISNAIVQKDDIGKYNEFIFNNINDAGRNKQYLNEIFRYQQDNSLTNNLGIYKNPHLIKDEILYQNWKHFLDYDSIQNLYSFKFMNLLQEFLENNKRKQYLDLGLNESYIKARKFQTKKYDKKNCQIEIQNYKSQDIEQISKIFIGKKISLKFICQGEIYFSKNIVYDLKGLLNKANIEFKKIQNQSVNIGSIHNQNSINQICSFNTQQKWMKKGLQMVTKDRNILLLHSLHDINNNKIKFDDLKGCIFD